MSAGMMMRRALVAAVMMMTVSAARAEDQLNTLTDQEREAGWKLLFDGKSTDGWRNYKAKGISDGWKVIDGALVRAKKGAGDIVTNDKYENFELSIEYRISKAGNSGIMYRVSEEFPAPWHTGPEIQIQDNVDGHDPQKSGWLYQLYKSEKDATKPAGEWNHLRVLISPTKCKHVMNGVKYCEYQIGSDEWKERVAKSKFASMPKFGKNETGYLCLQDHGDEVAYRNIKIRVIDGATPESSSGKVAK